MEKPPKLIDYDGKRDPDEHVRLLDEWLSYFNADDESNIKLFALTLVIPAQLLFSDQPDGYIDSWAEFHKRFSTQFTTQKWRPIIEVVITGIVQGNR